MLAYIGRRLGFMLVLLVLLSVVSFILIQLPPGDYLTTLVARRQLAGGEMTQAEKDALQQMYGLGLPLHRQYLKWAGNLLRGDLGRSFQWNRPVSALVAERLPLTLLISAAALLFTYLVAIPIGIYSATHQYSFGDYTFTVVGFVGLAIPPFLLALILMFLFFKAFDMSTVGLFSPEYMDAPWSWAKFLDLLKHLPIPIVINGVAGTAALIRVMRATLLDELQKQYVITARTKGLAERTVLFKYPVRMAINPIVSTVGWLLPTIVSGETITAIVLSLPTVGPLLYEALLWQDMFLAGSLVMVLGMLVVIGTFLSDLLLVKVDPRIRYEQGYAQ